MADQGRGRGIPHGGQAQGGAFVRDGHQGSSDRGGRGGRGGGHGDGGGGGRGKYGPPAVYRPANGVIPAPDMRVQTVENARQRARQPPSSTTTSLALSNTMPDRPGYGTEGTPITVFTNYVTFTPKTDLVLYVYDIKDIQPSAAGRKLSQIIRLVLNESNELAGYRDDLVTDFKSTLISRKQFPIGHERRIITITYKSEGEDEPVSHAQTYKVPVRLTKILTVGELMADLTSTNPTAQYDSKLELIQGLNIFLNHYAKVNDSLATIGSSKTFVLNASDNNNTVDLGQGLRAIRGFITSVRAATNRILVNINVSHGAFYQEGTLRDLMSAFKKQPFGKMATLGELDIFLQQLRIRTLHLGEKRNRHGVVVFRQKSIVGLAKPYKPKGNVALLGKPPIVPAFGAGPADVKFWFREPTSSRGQPMGPRPAESGPGRYVSVYNYFKDTYNIAASNDLPVINVGTEDSPSYLPAEVCVVLPGQNAKCRLNSEQTAQMVSFAVRPPWVNAKSIEEDGFETAGMSRSTNQLLDRFNVTIGQSLITIPARLLKEPYVQYQSQHARVVNGSWNMKNIKFNKPGKLKRWGALVIRNGDAPSAALDYKIKDVQAAVDEFKKSLYSNGLDSKDEVFIGGQELTLMNSEDPAFNALDYNFETASKVLDLLFIILPGRKKTESFNEKVYNQIKILGDIKYGIHTICVIGDKFKKKDLQFFGNVALKFNAKLGGNNQAVEQSRLSFITENKTMLVGLDVTHPSPGSLPTAPSVAGMVASIDKHLGQWPATLRTQHSRQEMVSDVGSMLKTHLYYWRSLGKHSSLPENIIVYRDGVSEGQYDDVLMKELPLLRQACAEMYPTGKAPRLTTIIVGKRHHTRFYPTRNEDMDTSYKGTGSGNLKAGTVVDRGVTEERTWDFFLQSHNVLQGTGRPAHYVVVLDEVFRARAKGKSVNVANEVEKLTHALSYTFARATKAVGICTPAYYADILCERARLYLADVFRGDNGGANMTASIGGQDLGSVEIHERLRSTMFYL